MAYDLAIFYLNFYAARKWRISFSNYLNCAQYKFGDILQLGFADELIGQLVEAGLAPGTTDSIDRMNFVIEAAILPEVPDNAVTTLTGEWLKFTDGEGITYV